MKKPRSRHPFVDLSPADLAADLPGDPHLFLGRFDGAALRRELEQAGVLPGLRERGYDDLTLRFELASGEHRLFVFPSGGLEPLVDLRLAEAVIVVKEIVPRPHGLELLSVLSIHWLALQDPRASFTAERPRFPGQRHPGLGLVRPLVRRLHDWARNWGKDGLLNFPEYFHNACLYAEAFRFVSPARQGRFEALQRDLAPHPLAVASSLVDAGEIVEEPGARELRWEPGEMIAPITAGIAAYLEGEEYRRAADAARAAVRFRLKDSPSSP